MRVCKTLSFLLILTVFFLLLFLFLEPRLQQWPEVVSSLQSASCLQPSFSSALLSKPLIKVFALLPLQKLGHKDSFCRLIEPIANDSEAARHHFLLTSPVTLACSLRGPSRPAGGHSSPPACPHVSSPSSSEMTIDQKAGININSH